MEAAPEPIDLTDDTMKLHKHRVLEQMKLQELDVLLIYADREHGTNFGYLTGFEPRFEEAVLILHRDGSAWLMLGNESLRMADYSRIPVKALHVPYFSLPNQPMDPGMSVSEALEAASVREGMRAGIAGWKMFTAPGLDNRKIYEVPYYITDALIRKVGGSKAVINATGLFIDPANGVRTTVGANEIAHYEYGASQASSCVMKMLDEIREGARETDLAEYLAVQGQPVSVQTICAAGERFTNAVVAPRPKKLCRGERFTTTMGLRGGLTSRCGYVVKTEQELPELAFDYLERVVKPYYAAATAWYAAIGVGVTGGQMYRTVEQAAPPEKYGWTLNPGHLTAGEEWMSSPIFRDSEIRLRSGMMLQMDIIFSIPGCGGANAEDGIVLADEQLRQELMRDYPKVYSRMQKRREYMMNILNIPLKPEVLPMAGSEGYLRPFLLNREKGMRIKDQF